MEQVSCNVVELNGQKTGTLQLPGRAFDAKIALDSVRDAVTWQLAKRRAGTHSALRKGDIPGRSRKPWKQKGTGRARAGDYKSPHWVGGGVAHGPLPRSYGGRLSRRVRTTALASVLTDKFREGKIVVVDAIPASIVKTKEWVSIFAGLGITGSVIVLLAPGEQGASQGMRNIPSVLPLSVEGINVYDLLRHDSLVVSKDAALMIAQRICGVELGVDNE
jgi:large subunit ribosomal protein L4